jgi:SAM-dependent methyltransferase
MLGVLNKLFARLGRKKPTRRFAWHYDSWIQSRVQVIEAHFGRQWFAGKSLLELGCGYAAIGEHFHRLGAQVTCVEARAEHVEHVRQHKPFLHVVQHDLDAPHWPFSDDYDLILHTGVLYHLRRYKDNLLQCLQSSEFLFLETEVLDSSADEVLFVQEDQTGYDQALNGIGCRPSASHLENLIGQQRGTFERCFTANLNAGYHVYDWNLTDSKTWQHGLRRAWFVRGTGGKRR